MMNSRKIAGTLLLCCLVLVAFLRGQQTPAPAEYLQFGGFTMGSSYSIKVENNTGLPDREIIASVQKKLDHMNRLMSLYQDGTEINRFNDHRSTDPFRVHPDFLRVVSMALEYHRLSDGYYDITVAPILNLWGFGPAGKRTTPPEPIDIEETLPLVGGQNLEIDGPAGALKKKIPNLEIDVGSIGPGFAVDLITELFQSMKIENFFIEAGGEVRVLGLNPRKKPWCIGINTPTRDAPLDAIAKKIFLTSGSVSTSGNYRNYFEYNGKFFGHTMNPKTGYPVDNDRTLLSVTIIGSECARVDALCTCVTSMPYEKAVEMIKSQPGYEFMLLGPVKEGIFETVQSPGFEKYLTPPASPAAKK